MCVNPIKINNPYHEQKPYVFTEGELYRCSSRFVSAKPFIYVPCGKCADCRASYYESIRQRALVESMSSYVYFITLTYDNKHLPYLSFTSDHGLVKVYYSDITHIQNLFKRLRNVSYLQDRNFRYLAVTEYGTAKFRPHHHILLFVAKKSDDDLTIPKRLESLLYDDIQRYYAINVGTRKNPIYEPLFTYADNLVNGKLYSNYTVSLVVDKQVDENHQSNVNTPQSISKSISYLVSYVNKTSKYDQMINHFLENIDMDHEDVIYRKISRLLKTQVYYSKYFGFGFDNGVKVRPSVPNFITTQKCVEISSMFEHLPRSLRAFANLYPKTYIDYQLFKKRIERKIHFHHLMRFRDVLDRLSGADDYLLLCLVYKYEPHWLHTVARALHRSSSYHVSTLPVSTFDNSYKNTIAYRFIRQSVEDGLSNNVEYLAFKDSFAQVPCYKPLCRFYKRYCTTIHDIDRLYSKLKIRNFDEYIDRMEFNMQSYLRKSTKQHINDNRVRVDVSELAKSVSNVAVPLLIQNKLLIFSPTAETISNIVKI